jgi:salicylate hydroxylase
MDGINSAVRKCFLFNHGLPKSPSIHPIWTGTVAYRGLVPIEKLEVALPGHRAVHTPMIVSSDPLICPYLSMRI